MTRQRDHVMYCCSRIGWFIMRNGNTQKLAAQPAQRVEYNTSWSAQVSVCWWWGEHFIQIKDKWRKFRPALLIHLTDVNYPCGLFQWWLHLLEYWTSENHENGVFHVAIASTCMRALRGKAFYILRRCTTMKHNFIRPVFEMYS